MLTQASIDWTDSIFSCGGMEARGKTPSRKPEPKNRLKLILECWKTLGRPAIGAGELMQIQAQLQASFGESRLESPASIARVLAGAGAGLRHPEVIECDARWRAARIQGEAESFPELSAAVPLTLASTKTLIERLEALRTQDSSDAQRLRDMAIEARKRAELRATRKALGELEKAEQIEITEWLGIWLKTPSLFKDWAELRRRSPDFRQKFER